MIQVGNSCSWPVCCLMERRWDRNAFLGKGLHALQIIDLPAGLPADAPVLTWEGPGATGAALSGPVPDSALFRKPPSGQGLLGTYYASDNWTGPELMRRVDPLLLTSWPDPEPVFGAFSATWTGELLAPADGLYAFQLDADDGVRLTVDGQMLGESLNPDTVNMVAATANLTAGPHPIRIDYFQRGGGKALEFFWQPPGQPMQPCGAAGHATGKRNSRPSVLGYRDRAFIRILQAHGISESS